MRRFKSAAASATVATALGAVRGPMVAILTAHSAVATGFNHSPILIDLALRFLSLSGRYALTG
jgi:hypothetical protein